MAAERAGHNVDEVAETVAERAGRAADITRSMDPDEASEIALREAREYGQKAQKGIIPKPDGGGSVAGAAVDMETGNVYHSLSGDMSPDAVNSQINLPETSLDPGNRPPHVCAEVGCVTRALDKGANAGNLVVATVRTRGGKIVPPCPNCESWVYDLVHHVVTGE